MDAAIKAVGDVFRWVPVKVRQVFYGLLGLVVLTNYIFDFLPDEQGGRLLTAFGVVGAVMALANTAGKSDPGREEAPPPEG